MCSVAWQPSHSQKVVPTRLQASPAPALLGVPLNTSKHLTPHLSESDLELWGQGVFWALWEAKLLTRRVPVLTVSSAHSRLPIRLPVDHVGPS